MNKILTGLAAIFFIIMIMEMTGSYDDLPPSSTSQGLDLTLPQFDTEEEPDNIQNYSAIIKRPLFVNDRRPYVPPVVEIVETTIEEVQPDTPNLDGYSLSAVIISGQKKIALISTPGGESVEHLTLSDKLNSWELKEIQANYIIFVLEDEQVKLELAVKPSPQQVRGNNRRRSAISEIEDNVTEETESNN